jgi:DNA helicase IV
VELSNSDEIHGEQEFIDGLYARVDVLRGATEDSVTDALGQGNTPMQARLERDILVAERSGLLAALNAVDGSLCFGRIDLTSGVSHHIGRIGIRSDDADLTPILIDWRADVARPFYLATGHTSMGLRRRRHLTTDGRRVTALHDEILDLGDATRTGHEDPSGDAVLLAALNSARTGRMSDIVQTIQAEQDEIIRAPYRGVLVVEAGLPHNEAREHFEGHILNTLTEMVAERIGTDPFDGSNLLDPSDITQIRDELAENPEVWAAIDQLWPRLTPQYLVADFLADPVGYVSDDDADAIRRPVTREWTVADVPLLDEAAELLGRDDRVRRARAQREREEQVSFAQGVLDVSFASRTFEFEDKEEGDPEGSEVLSAHDIIDAERFAERHEEEDHRSAAERAAADRTWAFGHIIVDEAQELSPMAWRLLMRRSPTRSMTLVGDPAQTAEAAGVGSWSEILAPYVEDRFDHRRLGVNYRTPAEIMDLAAAVVRAENPEFEPPSSVRATGVRPWVRATDDLPGAVAKAVGELAPSEGRLAVIAPRDLHRRLAARLDGVTAGAEPDLTRSVVLLDPRQAKGLEFDSVLVVEPGRYGTSDLYVALTRATQRLGVLHTGSLPLSLAGAGAV